MNRAFVSENDGWGFCIKKMESCMCANEKGQCVLDFCRLDPPKQKPEAGGQSAEASREKDGLPD